MTTFGWIMAKSDVKYRTKVWQRGQMLDLLRTKIGFIGQIQDKDKEKSDIYHLSLNMGQSLDKGWDTYIGNQHPSPVSLHVQCGAKNSCMFEFPAFLPPTNLGLPMHSPSVLTENMLLNLASYFSSTLYMFKITHKKRTSYWNKNWCRISGA